ncbi:hypothetical protein CPB83DRAFT_856773 [Crepidotus variabilis]|uniref:ER transporter 6TM N-terminal domain-containing protein n=1 Tax=Crepidotus variabilis TaxID=179855 RepID=A0A9P6EDL9_9AGAR|nr:hypothetical protein CPB83DRAFT_856773 [Crepidotus variabilis]
MADKPAPTAKSKVDQLFPGLKAAVKSKRAWKTFIRCWIVLTTVLVLMVADKSSRTMGQQASFFCVFVALMLPPSLALSVFFVAITTLLTGMLLGWAWGNAAMASAHNVRSATLLAQQQQQFKASLNPKIPVALQQQIAVFHGVFLDPRSSAVYGAFLFIGTFFLGAIRAYIPNLAILTIFATIVLDVVCTTGPLLPTTQYTLAKAFILPTVFYVAVAIGGIILIFPESLSHVWLSALVDDFWTHALELLRLQGQALQLQPSDHETWRELYAKVSEVRLELIQGADSLSSQLGLIGLDFSVGRLGPEDLRRMLGELRSLFFRTGSIQSFQAYVNDRNAFEQRTSEVELQDAQRFHTLHRKINEREKEHGHDLDSLVPILAECSASLRTACDDTINTCISWITECNSKRWRNLFRKQNTEQEQERHRKLVDEARGLEAALTEFRDVQRIMLVGPYKKFFDPKTKKLLKNDKMFASRSLFTCFVFIDTLDAFAEQLLKFLQLVIELDSQRRKTRFWFPGRIAKDTITGSGYKSSAGPFPMGTANDPTRFDSATETDNSSENPSESIVAPSSTKEKPAKPELFRETRLPARRNPDAFPPHTAFGKIWVKLGAFLRFFKSPEGIFAMRHAILSLALWIPAVCKPTAWFYYENKGLWALIMGQLGLAIYAGDQILNFLVRIIGTIIGLLLGMVVWYIGAGRGPGNAYGIVIASTFFLAPFLFLRISLPPQQMALWMMIGITIVFVAGYSWVNTHLNAIGNPGYGVTLGWKRALLVIIGFTAGFIVMLFPNPISSRVLVRKSIAAILNETGNIFATEIEAFLAEEASARKSANTDQDIKDDSEKHIDEESEKASKKEDRIKTTGRRALAIATRLKEIRPSLTFARFEPQLSGSWPSEDYGKLFELEARCLSSLILLITSFGKLDEKWCSVLVHKTPFMNPNFLSDVFSTIAVLSASLMHGHPLPAYLPSLRDRLIYHETHSFRGKMFNYSFKDTKYNTPVEKDNQLEESDTNDSAGPSKLDGASVGIEAEELTLDVLNDEHLPAHSAAIVSLSSLISRIDEMGEIIRKLCGEGTLKGYDSLQRFYIDQERVAGGGLFEVESRH